MEDDQERAARECFALFSNTPVIEAVRSKKSFANDAFLITTATGERFVLRLLRTQTRENAETEARIQERLAEKGMGVARYLRMKDGRATGVAGERAFTVAPYIAGESPASFTPALYKSFGATLARLHAGLEGFEVPKNEVQWLLPGNARSDLARYDGAKKSLVEKALDDAEPLFAQGLPEAVIHGDLWVDNVFAENDAITTVFDFETAERTLRILDLIRTEQSLALSANVSRETVRTPLIEGHDAHAHIPITPDERESWELAERYVAAACVIWCAAHGAEHIVPDYLAFLD